MVGMIRIDPRRMWRGCYQSSRFQHWLNWNVNFHVVHSFRRMVQNPGVLGKRYVQGTCRRQAGLRGTRNVAVHDRRIFIRQPVLYVCEWFLCIFVKIRFKLCHDCSRPRGGFVGRRHIARISVNSDDDAWSDRWRAGIWHWCERAVIRIRCCCWSLLRDICRFYKGSFFD